MNLNPDCIFVSGTDYVRCIYEQFNCVNIEKKWNKILRSKPLRTC